MLTYLSMMPVTEDFTTQKFIDFVTEWLCGSENKKGLCEKFVWDGSPTFSVNFDNDDSGILLEVTIQNCVETQSTAIRLKGTLNTNDWIADFILVDHTFSMQIQQNLTNLINTVDFYVPPTMPKLIDLGYAGKDNEFQITKEPLEIYTKDTKKLTKLYNEHKKFMLPVVYVTKRLDGTYAVDVDKLAKTLVGVAHVWVEKSPSIDKRLSKKIVYSKPSCGEIQIFYTNGYAERIYPNTEETEKEIRKDIINTVIQQRLQLKLEDKYQYHYISQSILQYEKQRIKLENETENKKICIRHAEDINKVFEMCDALEKERDRLLEENKRLQAEINDYKYTSMSLQEQTDAYSKKLNEMLDNNNVSLLYYGEETDLYQSEQLDILVDILTDVLDKNIEKSSRRRDVLESILKRNKSSGNLKERARVLERVLKDPKLNAQDKTNLRKADIYLSAENNHYKFQLANDPRYCVVIAKTLGDKGRGNKNATATIKKKFF